MVRSVPGVLISRDGTVREYVGHSNKKGTVLGHLDKREGSRWAATCAGCGLRLEQHGRNESAQWLRDHWREADSSMAASHKWNP